MDALSPSPTEEAAGAIDEHALACLDQSAQTTPFDTDLLQTTPARDIRAAIETALALLERLDYRGMLAKQGRISRLIGADVEARLKFELASQQVLMAMQQVRQAAANGKRVATLLRATQVELAADQARLESAVAWAQELHSRSADRADDFLLARFERRLANMMAMCSSNRVTAEQITLAETVLASLLDRVTDVDTILVPLWQRNMLALAHSAPGQAMREAADAFGEVQTRLITHLKQDQSA